MVEPTYNYMSHVFRQTRQFEGLLQLKGLTRCVIMWSCYPMLRYNVHTYCYGVLHRQLVDYSCKTELGIIIRYHIKWFL